MRGSKIVYAGLAAALVVGLACEGKGGASPSAGRAFSCGLEAYNDPKFVDEGVNGKIEGKVRVVCDKPPKSHHLTVKLQRSFNGDAKVGAWETALDSVVETDRIPPTSGMTVTSTHVGCISSVWRIRARAYGHGPDGTPFDFSLPVGETHPTGIKCSGPKK